MNKEKSYEESTHTIKLEDAFIGGGGLKVPCTMLQY